eukprot:CAMPEP_0119282200 /NCGR_PEP_ID=MMETSP1329-20130426/26238_1 /TAXON_ID=114041 /ORGANISM="Genus nov. species nov., Strain RCC1024" /LENGTH=43 /DNA_ID= /DNA_START= /DNA_END= /DNA_ORIENTATION=
MASQAAAEAWRAAAAEQDAVLREAEALMVAPSDEKKPYEEKYQ